MSNSPVFSAVRFLSENSLAHIRLIRSLKQRREELLFTVQKAERRMDLAVSLTSDMVLCRRLMLPLPKLEGETGENLMLTETVAPEQIAEVVSRWTGIPVTRLGQNEKQRLIGLADRLHQRMVGQQEAVNAIAEAVLRSRAGLGRPQQPTGSFLFLGPTGVGKTELAKALAEQRFDDENLLVRIDMSEYIDAAPSKEELAYRVDKNAGLVSAQTGKKSDILIQVPSGAVGSEAAQAVKKMKIMQDGEDVDDMEEE